MPKKTSTYSFGVSKREGHDSSPFYSRKIYSSDLKDVFKKIPDIAADKSKRAETKNGCEWKNKIFCHDSRDMHHVPDSSVALAFTSPPYCSGKDYDKDVSLEDYLTLIADVGREVYRCLFAGRSLRDQRRRSGKEALYSDTGPVSFSPRRNRISSRRRDNLG